MELSRTLRPRLLCSQLQAENEGELTDTEELTAAKEVLAEVEKLFK